MNYPYHSVPHYYHPYYQSLYPYSSQPNAQASPQSPKPSQSHPYASMLGQHRQLAPQATYPNYSYPVLSNPHSYAYQPTPPHLSYVRPTLQPQGLTSNPQQQIVIEISDQEPEQNLKEHSEKTHINPQQPTPPPVPINKIEPSAPEPPQPEPQALPKSKPIKKPQPAQRKSKSTRHPTWHEDPKIKNYQKHQAFQHITGNVHSKRIMAKMQAHQEQTVNEQTYQLLSINRLRQLVDEIMTGPQFQAEIPTREGGEWVRKVREELLGRKPQSEGGSQEEGEDDC